MFGKFSSVFQVLCLGITFSIHIQVVRFRYSDSGIQVWNSDLGIQDWVYRLADKYKHSHSVFTFRVIQVYNAGLGVQTCLYIQACIPKPEYPECEYCECLGIQASLYTQTCIVNLNTVTALPRG